MHNIHSTTNHNRGDLSLVREIQAGFDIWVRGLRSIQPVAIDTRPEEPGKESSLWDSGPGQHSHDEGQWQDDGGASTSGGIFMEAGTNEGCE